VGNTHINKDEDNMVAQPVHSGDAANFDLVCVICEELMTEPKVMSCQSEHMACSACLSKMPQKICPFDSEKYDELREPSMAIKRAIGNVQVYCKYHDRGCDWTGVFSNVGEHLRITCNYTPLPCVNQDCPLARDELKAQWPARKDWDTHNNACMYRKVGCENCANLILLVDLEKHYEECLKYPIPCINGCGTEKILREDMQKHLDLECSQVLIACPLKKYGCEHTFKRIEVETHMNENSNNHLLLISSKLEIQEAKLQAQEEALSSLNTFTFEWKIEDFMDIKDELLKSEACDFEGVQWHLELYPNGISEKK